MKLIRCDRTQYLKSCDTEKAFAIQYSRFGNGNVMFLSKKFVKMEEEKGEDNATYYWFWIPDWLCEKLSDDDKLDLELFDKDATQRVVEHDAQTKPKKWYSDRETCQNLKPFG